MGFHVILRRADGEMEHHYKEKEHELAALPITETSIIYRGEPHWKPELVKDSPTFKSYADPRYRGSVLAEQIFRKQATQKGYMVEVLSQDQESFKDYVNISGSYIRVKRGDFLLRNVGNLEVEVKCKSVYRSKKDGEWYFYFEKDHLERHLNMSRYTRTPIIVALYLRNEADGRPDPRRLFMMDVHFMKELVDTQGTKPVKRDWGPGYPIPLKKCMKDFRLVEYFKSKM